MSSYEDLRQYVAGIAEDAKNDAIHVMAYADDIEKCIAIFARLTSSSRISSAKTVETSFRTAYKGLLEAAKALASASKAGAEWSGISTPELTLKLTRSR